MSWFSALRPGQVSRFSVNFLNADTLERLCSPLRDLTFVGTPERSKFSGCHMRGDFVVFTCQTLGETGQVVNVVKLIRWKTGTLLYTVSCDSKFCATSTVRDANNFDLTTARDQRSTTSGCPNPIIRCAALYRGARQVRAVALDRISSTLRIEPFWCLRGIFRPTGGAGGLEVPHCILGMQSRVPVRAHQKPQTESSTQGRRRDLYDHP
jgi:hypothetical protein